MSGASSRIKGLAFLIIIALLVVVFFMDAQRRNAVQQLEKVSLPSDQVSQNQQQNREKAKEIVNKVRKLFDIPTDIEPTVATIVDVNALRARNVFYNKAENGDYLIITTNRAILYDPDKNIILDVVPVQIQAAGQK